MSDSSTVGLRSPFPRLHHFLYRNLSPQMRRATFLAERLRKREIAASLQRSEQGRQEWCALDHMIAREMATAKKEGRKPNFECQAIRSELLGYLIAGHETTSATLRWGVKFLITHQDAQSKLRGALRQAYPTALKEKRMPTLLEIIKARIPYLEATVEEILRCAKVLPITVRDALVDTQVMGIPIPKGTPVVFVANGPGLTLPSTAIPTDEKKYRRSDNAKSYMKKYGRFEDSDIEEFRPERWMRTQRRDDGTGQVDFDAQSFGWGPRACFGRKLACLKMRLFFTMAIWRFEFGELPEALGGYEETIFLTRAPTNVYVQLRKA